MKLETLKAYTYLTVLTLLLGCGLIVHATSRDILNTSWRGYYAELLIGAFLYFTALIVLTIWFRHVGKSIDEPGDGWHWRRWHKDPDDGTPPPPPKPTNGITLTEADFDSLMAEASTMKSATQDEDKELVSV